MNKNYILLPVFNDWRSLDKVLEILNDNFKKNKSVNHIIIINDASTSKVSFNKNYNYFASIKVLTLKKNVGSQKAIFFGLKYLQEKLKKHNDESIISILDSDGEDNPSNLYELIKLAKQKKDFFIFASRKKRTESFLLRLLNLIRLFLTYILIGRYINFGNFSSFSSSILPKLLMNNNLYLAYSSGILKNYDKFHFLKVMKNKRFFGKSKVNLSFLLKHSINIISVFYLTVLIRSAVILFIIFSLSENNYLNILSIISFFVLNISLFYINFFLKPKKTNLSIIKN